MDVDEKSHKKEAGRKKRRRSDKQEQVVEDQQSKPGKRKKAVTDPVFEIESKKLRPSKEIENDDEAGVSTEESPAKEPKEPSKRQMKKEKLQRKIAEQKESSKLEAAQKAITYISKWKHAKSDWKFEKLRQIWLMDHLLDHNSVPDSIFPIALEYFEGCKGMARQQLVKKMMQVVKKVEEQVASNKDETEATATSEYLRARQILQALPTEA
ncbi:cholesin [Neodiprion pinetum]|uniref:Uncharacterized protein C7orf50 homolog n=1 Tax=Neodiprion lecontei TaxID=441921 RepID=A0A6J0BBA8_NEOLC|nr:uncharacterized protein C7orf50 homolog [Neodiprion lecontei]XP_015511457.1 uncharacterized protein C7orf50 homolog [Neodiprion lecontei]XP_046484604.1 uncharacterized protein C7orf50 homolog [Neodiprion pinetum]